MSTGLRLKRHGDCPEAFLLAACRGLPMMKILLLLAFIAVASEAIAQDAQCVPERAAMVETVRAYARSEAGVLGPQGISETVLQAMGQTERHRFTPGRSCSPAYMDGPVLIGKGQTISQPFIVALMTHFAAVKSDHTVLEVGTGSGYQAAILARLVRKVCTVEIIPPLAEAAAKVLGELGYDNVSVKIGDGYHGWLECGPFDAIIVTAALGHVPPSDCDDAGPLCLLRHNRQLSTIKLVRPSGREDLGEMAVTAGSRKPVLLAPVHCAPKALSSPSTSNCPSLHHRERGSPMKNRKREICTSGSVRDEDGQPPHLLGRRNFLHLAAGAAALPVLSRIAWAQAYPTRPVRIISPFGTAGANDLVARLMGQWLSERLRQPFVIENRPGAAGNIGTEAVVKAPPDVSANSSEAVRLSP